MLSSCRFLSGLFLFIAFPFPSSTAAPPQNTYDSIATRLMETGWPNDVLINLNFPDQPASEVTEVEVTAQGRRDATNMNAERRTDRRGRDYYWMGFSDCTTPPVKAE